MAKDSKISLIDLSSQFPFEVGKHWALLLTF